MASAHSLQSSRGKQESCVENLKDAGQLASQITALQTALQVWGEEPQADHTCRWLVSASPWLASKYGWKTNNWGREREHPYSWHPNMGGRQAPEGGKGIDPESVPLQGFQTQHKTARHFILVQHEGSIRTRLSVITFLHHSIINN